MVAPPEFTWCSRLSRFARTGWATRFEPGLLNSQEECMDDSTRLYQDCRCGIGLDSLACELLHWQTSRLPQGRAISPINRNWRYHPAKVDGAESPGFDDSKFERVVIPHTNIELPWHNFDDKDYEFISTYRRRFKFPKGARASASSSISKGVMTASTVWINGVRLGDYKGGFTPFSFELTKHLRQDAENVLVVQVDSTERADIPPFGYEIDYMTFGGIYREVALRIVPPTYIDNIFAQPKDVLERQSLARRELLPGRRASTAKASSRLKPNCATATGHRESKRSTIGPAAYVCRRAR